MPVGAAIGISGAYAANRSSAAAKDAAKASTQAAGVQADSQQQSLDYLKQINALPQALREEALLKLQEFSQNYQGHQYGTDFQTGDIQNWLQQNPNASDAEIAVAMQRHGISPTQMAAATGKPLNEIQDRFQAQGGIFNRGPMSQDQLITQAQGSPLYAAIMGTQRAGEQSILRNSSATGGLRSGNSNGALTDFGQQTANRALLAAYADGQATDRYNQEFGQNQTNFDRQQAGNEFYREQGIPLGVLTGMAGLSGNEGAIAGAMSDIGATQAGGMLGSAQAMQQGNQNGMNNLMSMLGLGIQAYGNGMIKF
jgi:hypothetical protein